MYTSIAQGGPRDGIKLTCPPQWDGRVRVPTKTEQPVKIPWYPGRYLWEAWAGWVWYEDIEIPQFRRYECGGYHQLPRKARIF